jgi:hypothetical protein
MPTLGLITNPASSKDIRRLTGLARVVDVEEKANLVARLLAGVGSVDGLSVIALDDRSGLVRRAVRLAGSSAPPVELLDVEAEGTEADTRRAAARLATFAVEALEVVGGDGTVRAAAEGWPGARLVPLAAGTNNAFALTDEPTVVGLAAALAVTGDMAAFTPTTAVTVETSDGTAVAVIDAIAVRDRWIGSGAIWDPDRMVEGLVTSARRTAVGLASVSAAFGPLQTGHARWIRFGGTTTVRAVFGPGLVCDVPVAEHRDVPIGASMPISGEAGLVALDGERRLPAAGGRATVIAGPRVLDPVIAFSSSLGRTTR